MNYYDNAVEAHEVAELLYDSSKYRFSIYNSCLAMELYLKSRLQLVDDWEKYEFSHDIINIYRHLTKRFISSKDLLKSVTLGRKYFNESRYPHGDMEAYTKEFAQEFLDHLSDIRNYVDNECVTTLDDLKNRFRGD